jgi:hypothetical protein
MNLELEKVWGGVQLYFEKSYDKINWVLLFKSLTLGVDG